MKQFKDNQKLIISLVVVVIVTIGAFIIIRSVNPHNPSSSNSTIQSNQSKNFMLDGYPIDTVPLYNYTDIDSMLFYSNNDPNGFAALYNDRVNYYNVVLDTTASQSEFISYYRSLMSDVDENYSSEYTVEGNIDKYYVSASKYSDDDNSAYLQVFLPDDEYQEENRYFENYPNLFEEGENWTRRETSYGLLNQSGGEIEYTLYYTYSDDMEGLKDIYVDKYSDKSDFEIYEDSISWTDEDYEITITFSSDHGRVYVMIRRPM